MPSLIPQRSIIQISGTDADKFLQNLVTNDVLLMNDAIYAMMLSPQGRFLFDMFIILRQGGYLLDVFTGTKDLLLKKLRMYKINMQVEIEDIEGWFVGYAHDIPQDGIYYQDPRYAKLGYRIIAKTFQDDSLYLRDKYKYAIPDGGLDLLYDNAMPQEYGAEQLHAISYTKGCYVGQEVISRTKSQGVVRKRIYKIAADFDLVDIVHGVEITIYGVKVGIFCSGLMQEGMALIRDFELEDLASAMLDGKNVRLSLAGWYV